MVGQGELIESIESHSLDTLPHSLLLIGEPGCGKHTLAQELGDHYRIGVVDMTDNLTLEAIQGMYLEPYPHFYVVDMNRVTEKSQNTILKFLEEPCMNAYLILLATSRSILLDTVMNRCVPYEFRPYARNELMQFLDFSENVEVLLDYCNTPGQVLKADAKAIPDLIKLCDNIISNVGKARFPNIFRVSDRLDVDDKGEGHDLSLFHNVLMSRLLDGYAKTHDRRLYLMYNEASKSLKALNCLKYNKRNLMDSLMIALWGIGRQ